MFEFRLLGHLEVRYDGVLIKVRPRKLRELLAVLLLADGAVVSTDRIGHSLWESRPPKNAKSSIQVYVSQLRTCLGDRSHSLIDRTDNGYRLATEGYLVDLGNFEELIEDGLGLLRANRHRFALKNFDDALGMIRGEPLSDFTTSEFARPHIDYIENLRDSAWEGRLEARLALGSHRQVIAEARPLLHEDPFNEQLWAILMTALYRSHRRTEALRSYQIAVTELAEAGLEPSERLRELESKILAEDPSLLPTPHAPPNNLPDRPGPPLTDDEARRLVGDLRAEPVLTLVGPHRLTRVAAIEVARRSLPDFADGAWVVDLDGRRGPQVGARAILDGLTIIPGPDPKATLDDYLGSRAVLLVLLNTDGVGAEIGELADALPAVSSNSKLITTAATAADGAAGLVRSVAGAEPTAASGPTDKTAELLLARMQIFAGPVTLAAIKEVIAFPPIKPEDADYLLGRLLADDRVLVDNTGSMARFAVASTRHIDPTAADLEEAGRRHGRYCHDLAGRIAVGLDGPGRRDLLSAAGAEHQELGSAIPAALEEDRLDDALCIGHAAGRYWASQGSHLGRAITVLAPLANRITEPSRDAIGVHLGLGFAHFRAGTYDRSAEHYDAAVDMALADREPALAGRALAERGHLRMFLGDHVGARVDLDEAGRIADQAGSATLRARSLMLLAQLGMRSPTESGRIEQRDQLDEAGLIYQRLGHSSGQANSLLVKSSWYIDVDRPDTAVETAERALQIAQLGEDRSMLAIALVRSAESLSLLGQMERAHARAVEALRIAVDLGNWLVGGQALLAIGQAAGATPSDAARQCKQAFVAIRNQLGVPLTERERRWTADLDRSRPLSPGEARQVAYRLAL